MDPDLLVKLDEPGTNSAVEEKDRWPPPYVERQVGLYRRQDSLTETF